MRKKIFAIVLVFVFLLPSSLSYAAEKNTTIPVLSERTGDDEEQSQIVKLPEIEPLLPRD